MIAHHQGAIDMSEVLVRQGGDPKAVAMARRIIDDQRQEIGTLTEMLGGSQAAGSPAA